MMPIIKRVRVGITTAINTLMDPLWLLWLAYLFLTIMLLSHWTIKNDYSVTGDEPHYLVMADGIIRDGTFEQTAPYSREFQSRAIYVHGLAPIDAVPSPQNTHAVNGPHGFYNVHNIGLPLLLSLPFAIAGTFGAKLLMVFLGSLIVPLVWAITGLFTSSRWHRILTTSAIVFASPMLPASNQIYPDLPAGAIGLAASYVLLKRHLHAPQTNKESIAIALLISILPWLQIKCAAAGIILASAFSLQTYLQSRSPIKSLLFPFAMTISLSALAAYNLYAFGKATGPYQDGALEISWHAFMVLIGLHIDRFQGIFIQNPIYFLGLLFTVPFLKKYHLPAISLILVYASFVVPNALHPNWYGGYSFAGRFAWSAAIMSLPLVIFATIKILTDTKNGYLAVLLIMAINIYTFTNYADGKFCLLNVDPSTPLDRYVGFYPSISSFLPALYDPEKALSFPPNASFLVFSIGLFVLGLFYNEISKKTFFQKVSWFCTISLAFMMATGFTTTGHQRAEEISPVTIIPLMIWRGADLPSQVGIVQGRSRAASPSESQQGFLTFGPYIPLAEGRYRFKVIVEAYGLEGMPIGWIDVYIHKKNVTLFKHDIFTSKESQSLDGIFEIDAATSKSAIEVRTFYHGHGELKVHSIAIENLKFIPSL